MAKKFNALLEGMSRQRRDRINAKTRKMIMFNQHFRMFFFWLIVVGLIIFWCDIGFAKECKFIVDEPYEVVVGWSKTPQTRYKKVMIGPYTASKEQLRYIDDGASIIIKTSNNKFITIPAKASYICDH